MYRNLIFILIGLISVAKGAVLGIDFGSEFMKISIITPGKPFSIIEDMTSKRKTYSAVESFFFQRNFNNKIDFICSWRKNL